MLFSCSVKISFGACAISVILFCASVSTSGAQASERMEGFFDLGPHLDKTLRLKMDGEPASILDTKVGLAFIDPRPAKEIERIMQDPSYRPTSNEYAQFWTETKIRVKGFSKPLSETALCNWDQSKRFALCSIENDGGRFQIERAKATISSAIFYLIIRPLGGYRGFRIGSEETDAGLVGVDLRLATRHPARIAITLR
jgi:hypothetical protein